MEGSSSDLVQKTLTGELIQGMEFAKQLRQNLSSKASQETREFLVQRILSSYEKALLILKWSDPVAQPQLQAQQQQQPQPQQQQQRVLGVMTTCLSVPESPISATESPRSDDQDFVRDGSSKKRKTLPRWTDQVRVNSENGLEGPQDDGYSWRKYGQKDILGAKYPRSYYRCTFRNTQSCWATKQVQRSHDDPYLFDITYRGNHTCSQSGACNSVIQPPTSPQNQDQKPNSNIVVLQQPDFGKFPPNFPSNLRVVTEDLDKIDNVITSSFSFPSSNTYTCLKVEDPLGLNNEAFLGGFSQTFMTSPATPESSYYQISPFQQLNNNPVGFHHNTNRSDSDLTDIISATTSASNSPIPELDFSLDHVDIDPNFPFDTPGFFS